MPPSISVYTSANVFVIDPSSAHIFVFVDIIALDYSLQQYTTAHGNTRYLCTVYLAGKIEYKWNNEDKRKPIINCYK